MSWRDALHDDRLRTHRAWVRRGRVGEGRLVLSTANLAGARSSGDDFSYTCWHDCIAHESYFEFGKFEHAELVGCRFDVATAIRGRFTDATIRGCSFSKADLRRNWFLRTSVKSSSFDGANLFESNFVEASIDSTSFREANLDVVQLDEATFRACDLRRARLTNETAHGTVFEDCDLRGANLDKLRLKDTRFVRCRFARVTGTALIEGAYDLVDPDFTDDEPYEGPRSSEELQAAWKRPQP